MIFIEWKIIRNIYQHIFPQKLLILIVLNNKVYFKYKIAFRAILYGFQVDYVLSIIQSRFNNTY